MTKEYRSNGGIAFGVTIDGKPKRIVFTCQTKGSYYITSDPQEIEAIEAFKWYGDKYYLARVEDALAKVEDEPEESDDDLTPMTFHSATEARDYLMSTYGETTNATKTLLRIQNTGLKHGLKIYIE